MPAPPDLLFGAVIVARQFEHCPGFRMIEKPNIGVTGSAVWTPLLESCQLPLEFVFFPPIVGIKKSDPFASRFLNSPVAGNAHSLVGLIDIPNPIAESGTKSVIGSVRRAVVHDDNLKRWKALHKDTFKSLLHLLRAIVGRYDDTDLWIHFWAVKVNKNARSGSRADHISSRSDPRRSVSPFISG
jgi:hypothetical protein